MWKYSNQQEGSIRQKLGIVSQLLIPLLYSIFEYDWMRWYSTALYLSHVDKTTFPLQAVLCPVLLSLWTKIIAQKKVTQLQIFSQSIARIMLVSSNHCLKCIYIMCNFLIFHFSILSTKLSFIFAAVLTKQHCNVIIDQSLLEYRVQELWLENLQ